MPKYDYICDHDHKFELTHSIADCAVEHRCSCGLPAHRVPAVKEAYFWGPGFASTDGVARANVGRNPNNQHGYGRY